jgi:DNA segregation ATPase FtsK/SpoIIIE-like protein
MDKLDLILKELKNLNERVAKLEGHLMSTSIQSDVSHDPMIVEVVNFIRNRENISAADLQRKFDIGYARSSRILDELIDLNFVINEGDHNSNRRVNTSKFEKLKTPTEKNQIKDILLLKAIDVVEQFDKASASLLQRRLAIGYARASKLLDELENHGYVGTAIGALPRIVHKVKH